MDVVCIGCGEPKKAMGWYHLTQLLEEPKANVRAVVEPWYLGAGANSPGSEAFRDFQDATTSANPGIAFVGTVAEVPPGTPGVPLLVMIATRTKDMPAYFNAACDMGATHIYLEKPGADSANLLTSMRDLAASRGIQVAVGYNKNVSKYCLDAIKELEASDPQDVQRVILEHNNPFVYGSTELKEFIQGPGAEGMLHNMCCHELALAVTYLGLRRSSIASISLNPDLSELLSLDNGNKDWCRVSFSIKLSQELQGQKADSIEFQINRCGGNFSRIHLRNGEKSSCFQMPCDKHKAWVDEELAKDPDIRPYFLIQSPDYKTLKSSLIERAVKGEQGLPFGVASIDVALEVLHLADLLKPVLQELWAAGAPWTWTPPN